MVLQPFPTPATGFKRLVMKAYIKIEDQHLCLYGGNPRGKDTLHEIVAEWPGWKRSGLPAKTPGGMSCSRYAARLWPSSILPLLEQKSIELIDGDPDVGNLTDYLAYKCYAQVDAAKLELDPPPSHHAPLKWADEWVRSPMPHQVKAIRAIEAMGYCCLLADDMGLGKTASSLYAWQQSGSHRALIVCPKTVKRNWLREIRKTLKEVEVYMIDGTPKQRANTCSEILAAMRNPQGARQAIIINYDLLHRLPERERKIIIDWTDNHTIICDESHYLKNRKAGRFEFVYDHLTPPVGGARVRLLLSGTPVRNTNEDLWSQIEIVRPGTWSSFHQFDKMHLARGKFVIDDLPESKAGKPRQKIINKVRGTKRIETLNAVVNTLQVRRKKEEVLDLPEKIFTYPDFELDPPTAKIYQAMKQYALMELADLGDNTPIFAPHAKSALEATMRLEQICQGFLGGIPEAYLEQITPLVSKYAEKIEGRPGHLIFPKSAKIEWLTETIDSIILQGGRPIVFSRFNTPMFWLVDQWKDAEMLHGGLNMKQRDDIIERFQQFQIPVLFCQVKIAEGFNLTASQDVIFYGRDWSPAINSQATDRAHRMGQTGTVNVQIPIMHKTFETYLHKRLAAKEADAEQALRSITVGELRKQL